MKDDWRVKNDAGLMFRTPQPKICFFVNYFCSSNGDSCISASPPEKQLSGLEGKSVRERLNSKSPDP